MTSLNLSSTLLLLLLLPLSTKVQAFAPPAQGAQLRRIADATTSTTTLFYDKYTGSAWDEHAVIDRKPYMPGSGGGGGAAAAASSGNQGQSSHDYDNWYNPEDYLLETTTTTAPPPTMMVTTTLAFARKSTQITTRHQHQHDDENDYLRTFNPEKYPELHNDRVVAAGVGTGVLAALVAGPIGGIMAGFTAAYVAEHEKDNSGSVVGNAVIRAVGDAALQAKFTGMELDRKHHIVDKTLHAAEEVWEMAKELDREHRLVQTAKNVAIYSTAATADFVKRHNVLERGMQGIGASVHWLAEKLVAGSLSAGEDEIQPRRRQQQQQQRQRQHIVSYEPYFSPERMAFSSSGASSSSRSSSIMSSSLPSSQPYVWPNQTPTNPRQQQQPSAATSSSSSSSQGSLGLRPTTNPYAKEHAADENIVKFSAFAKKRNQPPPPPPPPPPRQSS